VVSVVRKNLMKFDMEKSEWYYQPKIYINRQDADSTYNELKGSDWTSTRKPKRN
jgi:hypothetical protein